MNGTPCWRLIHDGSRAIKVFYSQGVTSTPKNLFFGNTIDDCFGEIDNLSLDFTYVSGATQILFSGGSRYESDVIYEDIE